MNLESRTMRSDQRGAALVGSVMRDDGVSLGSDVLTARYPGRSRARVAFFQVYSESSKVVARTTPYCSSLNFNSDRIIICLILKYMYYNKNAHSAL